MEYDDECRRYARKAERKWEHTRFVASILLNVNRGKNSKVVKPEDLVPLSIDGKRVKETKEDLKAYKKDMDESPLVKRLIEQKKNGGKN